MARMRRRKGLGLIVLLAVASAVGMYLVPSWQAAAPEPPPPMAMQAAVPPPAPPPLTVAEIEARLDAARMLRHVQALAGEIGVRGAGTPAERAAADYVAEQLRAWGYTVHEQEVALPTGRLSVNIIAELPGRDPKATLVGAHIDSKPPSPGANDNASGVAVLLELACVLRDTVPPRTILFVGFGAEERIGQRRDHHHFGSRHMARDADFIAGLHSMTSPDMVGVGTMLHIDNLGQTSDAWRDTVARAAAERGVPFTAGRSRPVSDHEAFERVGVPVAYVHWERDPHYHRRTDTPDRIRPELLLRTATIMLDALLGEGDVPRAYPADAR